MVLRKREGLWGFQRTEVTKQHFGAVEAAEGRRESCGGMEKGAGRVEVRKEGKGFLWVGDEKEEGGKDR